MASVSVRSLITDSLYEIGAQAPGESLDAAVGTFCLSRLSQLLDNWNAQREAVYAETIKEFTFIANQQSYTIGPTGADFTVTSRPVTIDAANVLLNTSSPTVTNPINIRDYQWWAGLTVQAISTTFPTDLYYEPSFESSNGVLRFWPKPTTAYGLQLFLRTILGTVTITSTLVVPPGYQNALTLTLAEDVAQGLGRQLSPMTVQKAREARARIFINNAFTPLLATQDSGMPSNNRNRCTFNYRTGLDVNVSR